MKEYYGDDTRWFIGIVKDINDPLELGRIRVRIFGIHSENTSDISDGDLPWASVAAPITEGGTSGIGTNLGIKPQAQVYGIFLDGKSSQLPLVLGSIPKYERPITPNYIANEAGIPDQVQRQPLTDAQINVKNDIPANKIDDTYLIGGTNIEKAFNFFISQQGGGFSHKQACGIIGNFFVESGANQNNGDLNPKARSGGSERSFGIAQWNSSANAKHRYQKLVNFAASKNIPWDTMYCQLLFTVKELYDNKTYYRLNDLKRAQPVREACLIFEDRFENPKVKGQQERISAGEEIYRRLNDG